MCVRAAGIQPPATVIFPGTGKRILASERAQWDPDVVVKFQPKAWADTAFCLDWLRTVFIPHRQQVAKKGTIDTRLHKATYSVSLGVYQKRGRLNDEVCQGV